MKGIKKGNYNNIDDELVDSDELNTLTKKEAEEWADARVKDTKEKMEKESNTQLIVLLLLVLWVVWMASGVE